MRGLPGSGKSTKAKELAGENGSVFSTDDFFIDPETGEYKFEGKKIPKNNILNIKRTEEAMINGVTPIIIDNTNVRFFEMKSYVKLAQRYGYKVEFHEPDTEWKWNVEELVKRNKHGARPFVIKRMKNRWQENPTVDDILKSKAPWEKKK